MLDKSGVKAPAAIGCAIGAVGFYLWAQSMPAMDYGSDWWRIVIAGAGTGLMFAPVSTDALNRVPGTSYGEATGITQTMRNLGASLGLAVLGTLLVSQIKSNAESTLTGDYGCDKGFADGVAAEISSAVASGGEGGGSGAGGAIPECTERLTDDKIGELVPGIFADASETIFLVMAGVMVVAYAVSHFVIPSGKAPELDVVADGEAPTSAPPDPAT